jgi:hypothetical protein
MTKAHSNTVMELAPRQLFRTFTLSEAARLVTVWEAQNIGDLAALRPHLAKHDVVDIPDPIGQSLEVFESVGAQIAELLPPILELCQRSKSYPNSLQSKEIDQALRPSSSVRATAPEYRIRCLGNDPQIPPKRP